MKKPISTLALSLNRAAGREQQALPTTTHSPKNKQTVLVAAHFTPEVRRVLKLIEADSGKNLKQLLGEAINMLAAQYGKPEPFREGDD